MPASYIPRFLIAFLLTTLAVNSFAQRGGVERVPAPFNKKVDNRFRALENDKRVLKLPYSFTSSPAAAAATITLGKALPAGSLITKVYSLVATDVVSANGNTIAIGCGSTNDLGAANDFSDDAVNAVVVGAVTGEAAAVYTASGCTPTLTIGAGASGITAGSMVFFVEFIDPDNNLALGELDFNP